MVGYFFIHYCFCTLNSTSFEYEYNSVKYKIQVMPNKYYPTKESMIKIYLGAADMNSAINKQEIHPYMVQKVLVVT